MSDLPIVTDDTGGGSASADVDLDARLRAEGIDPGHYARRWWTLGTLCLSLLIIMVANTTLNVALPRLMEDLPATQSQAQWLVDAYSLVFAGLLFTAGNLGDRYGRKGVLQIGLVLFAGSTLYAAFAAHTAAQLTGARVVMGAAAAFVMPATLSIITNVFPRRERARAVALWAGISGAGTALGPLLSGFVLEHADWNMVFVVNLPIIVLALVLGWFFVPKVASDHHTRLDLPGAVLSAVGLSLLVYALIEAPMHGWLAPPTMAVGAAAVAVLAAFVWWERRIENPMLDVRLFRVSAFGVSSLVLTLVFFALFGMFFSISQLLQLVYGYTPLESAVRMLPVTFAMVIAAPRSAALAERLGKRRVVGGGMWLVAAGVFVISLISVEPNYPLLVLGLFVMATGMGLAMSPTTDLLMSSVPRRQAGMGSAMNDTTRELGGSLGVAVFGSILASRYSGDLGPALAALPDVARDAASGSLAAALKVAESAGPAGAALAGAAREAWVAGFRTSLMVGVVVLTVAGLIAFRFLPDRAADHDEPEPATDRDDVLDVAGDPGVAPAGAAAV